MMNDILVQIHRCIREQFTLQLLSQVQVYNLRPLQLPHCQHGRVATSLILSWKWSTPRVQGAVMRHKSTIFAQAALRSTTLAMECICLTITPSLISRLHKPTMRPLSSSASSSIPLLLGNPFHRLFLILTLLFPSTLHFPNSFKSIIFK